MTESDCKILGALRAQRAALGPILATIAAGTLLAACAGATKTDRAAAFPQGSEPVTLDPAAFTTKIDNRYWPMTVGTKWVFRETDGEGTVQRNVVEVTARTKRIANGVVARVVRDTATAHSRPVEATDDWYAQDAAGNIWYLGERVTNYKYGRPVDHAGSWEAGVDGAQAGVAMPAQPVPGMTYRQEYYKDKAEDMGTVITVGEERVGVPFGFFSKNVLMTRDTGRTEPKVQELKFYAPGVGPLLSVHTDGPGERSALISYTKGR